MECNSEGNLLDIYESQNVKGVVAEDSESTSEGNRRDCLRELAINKSYQVSQIMARNETLSDAVTKSPERLELGNSCMGASLHFLVVPCVLLVIFLMRVERAVSSLKTVTGTLEQTLNVRQ